MAFAHHGGDRHALLIHDAFDIIERGIGLGHGGAQILGLTVGKVSTDAGEWIRVDHIHRSHGRAKHLCQLSGFAHRCQRSFGAIHRHQNMVEHGHKRIPFT